MLGPHDKLDVLVSEMLSGSKANVARIAEISPVMRVKLWSAIMRALL